MSDLAHDNAGNGLLQSRSDFIKNVHDTFVRWGMVDALMGEARPMSFLKRTPTVFRAEDIAMGERLRAVSCRGKLETTVYEAWQHSEPLRPRRRRPRTVEA